MNYIDAELPASGNTVLVGMSGGVDSTLTALMLKEKGCRVIGVTMSLWDGSLASDKESGQLNTSCFGPGEESNIAECRAFCEANQIEYHVIDVKAEYRREVIEYFKNEYRSGRTPNPCIRCNSKVKFYALLKGVEKLGIQYDYFCTGHYAKIVRPEEGLYGTDVRPCMIAGAVDASKDQTYFLYRVPSEILEKVRFPLASIKKTEVVALAEKARLAAAKRAESQDFISGEYLDMLFADKPSVSGDILDLDGKVIGKHRGIEFYTIGQRRGLGVAVNYPVYVHSIDAKNNVIVLAPNDQLNSSALIAEDCVWPGEIEPSESFNALVKIRLASKPAEALVEKIEGSGSSAKWKVTFDLPQRAVAPGQSAVFYKDGVIIGGGIISEAIK